MKPHPAFAVIEFNSVPVGLFAADALLKKSPISLIRSGTIGAGRFLILLAGTTASVAEAHEEALFHGGLQVADDVFLPDIHPALYDGILGNVRNVGDGPVLVLETPTVSCNIQAVERAMKGVPVDLLEFRAGDPRMDGRGLAILQGDLYDIEAAQEIALATLETRGIPAQHRILTAPHDALLAQLSVSTRFDLSKPLALEGETAS
ncbi:MAG TPA: BMC domain-containing protein [Kiritimatiellia bacterium]|jgi:microcompartment protein CcmL/EutN|nr:BMC domain-containing protein [Kiritimatiellia bacterium]OQC57703.1 MAG: BMC domain protein [Verrucomicrobia bacterium ADurb.Bin018]MBP9571454.1 BMC domain-containing protein [Kiritimatiellia bacterium]HOE00550.1 BMC domain-containing protein [Kiritimatiellia bacterium]HOE37394.1 BMC domain-containing protein [Kiritimatiellia bacterium]